MGCNSSDGNVRDTKPIINSSEQSAVKLETPSPPRKPVLPEIAIYYGSQTGNSSRFAHELAKEAQEKYELNTTVLDLGNFDEKDLPQKKLVFFVVSTYGEGGPTDSAQRFYYWLKNDHCIEKERGSFAELRFAVFGCGDSNFKKNFNRMAKLTEEKMLARGAQKIFETGLGDDSKDLKADFLEWKAKLWPAVASFYQAEQHATIPLVPKKECSYVSQFEILHGDKPPIEYSATDYAMSTKQYLLSKSVQIAAMKKIRESENATTFLIELNIAESGLKYKTMDYVAVFPENDPKLVEELAKSQSWELEKTFALKCNEGQKPKIPFPVPTTIKEALTKFCNLRGLLSKEQLLKIKELCQEGEGQNKIKGWIEQYDEFKVSHKSIVEVLDETRAKVPFVDFIQICDRIEPRYYAIASSSKKSPETISIAVAMQHKTINEQQKLGLATSYFERIYVECFEKPATTVILPQIKAFTRTGSMRIPGSPLILVATGTGVAKFMGMLEERETGGQVVMLYGCREKEKGGIFIKELNQLAGKGVINKLLIADSNIKKKHVQDLIREYKDVLYLLIKEEKAVVMVCASLNVEQAVREAIIDIIKNKEEDPNAFFNEMKTNGQYVKELWNY